MVNFAYCLSEKMFSVPLFLGFCWGRKINNLRNPMCNCIMYKKLFMKHIFTLILCNSFLFNALSKDIVYFENGLSDSITIYLINVI